MFRVEGNQEITRNDYVGPIVRKANRTIIEIDRSLSQRISDVKQADVDRINACIDSIETLIKVAAADPAGDYPISHSRMEYELEVLPPITVKENEVGELIINQLKRFRFEVAHGQTSELPTGIHELELPRFLAYLERTRNLLRDYVAIHKPQDHPATTPSKPIGENPSAGVTGPAA